MNTWLKSILHMEKPGTPGVYCTTIATLFSTIVAHLCRPICHDHVLIFAIADRIVDERYNDHIDKGLYSNSQIHGLVIKGPHSYDFGYYSSLLRYPEIQIV